MPDFTQFSSEPNSRRFSKGQRIFAEGDPGDYLYAVLEGEVAITRGDRQVATIVVGGVFGEMALIDQKPRSATATARTDVRLAAIDRNRFLDLVHNTPFFAVQMMQVLSDRVRRNLES
jgi:CRP/FNR family transcriptional regulator, cyclic AMP receptor protein